MKTITTQEELLSALNELTELKAQTADRETRLSISKQVTALYETNKDLPNATYARYIPLHLRD